MVNVDYQGDTVRGRGYVSRIFVLGIVKYKFEQFSREKLFYIGKLFDFSKVRECKLKNLDLLLHFQISNCLSIHVAS